MKKLPMFLWLLLSAASVWAQQSAVFVTDAGAIHGYDPVAFFREQKPVPGLKTISYTWQQAQWYFSSEENKAAFIASPETYAPQYGGYCAFGMSNGYKAPTQIDTWTIVDGKLYFNYNKQVQKDWNANREALIRKANTNWPAVKDKP